MPDQTVNGWPEGNNLTLYKLYEATSQPAVIVLNPEDFEDYIDFLKKNPPLLPIRTYRSKNIPKGNVLISYDPRALTMTIMRRAEKEGLI